MGEKASIFQGVQIGIESEVGTPVAANKKLLGISMVPGPRVESSKFRAMGQKYPSSVAINKEWTELAISGLLSYNEIVYLLSSLISAPTPAQQGATTAYKWTFVSNTSAEDVGKTFTVEQGDANSAWEAAGARVSGLTLTFNRNEVTLNGSGLAEALVTGISLTGSPTEIDPIIVLPGHLSFKMADTQAGLAGATAMTRGFSMEWSLTEKIGMAWPVGQDPVTVEKEPEFMAKLRLATDTVGHGLLATMRANTTKWFRIKGTGALIEDTYYNDFQIDFPAKISDAGDPEDNEGIHVMEYALTGIHDSTWGKAFQIDIINALSAL